MASSFLFCFLPVQFVGVLARIEYNTKSTAELTRSTPFSPSVISKTCLLKPDVGPCRGNIQMYYFDPKKNNCSRFYWGGCQGNGNKFDTRAECTRNCLSSVDDKPSQPRYCLLSFDYGYCFGALKRWHYDRYWKVCKESIYSGCGGNKNNFYKFDQCDRVCRLRKPPILRAATTKSHLKKLLIINPETNTTKLPKKNTRKDNNTMHLKIYAKKNKTIKIIKKQD